jgi:TM2 domain-containing membrane protein YozV
MDLQDRESLSLKSDACLVINRRQVRSHVMAENIRTHHIFGGRRVADAAGNRLCAACKRALHSGDEWIALDGGEIWCAECWQKRFTPQASRAASPVRPQPMRTSPATAPSVPESDFGLEAPEAQKFCEQCGNMRPSNADACPSCGAPPAPSAGPASAASSPSLSLASDASAHAGSEPYGAGASSRSEAPWYYLVNNKQVGPVSTAALAAMIQAGQINLNTMVWQKGSDGWKPASLVSELAAAAPQVSLPATVVMVPQAQPAWAPARYHQGKSKVTAGLLALLVGGLGIHKFYLGAWGWGLLYILFIWTFIPLIASFIEGIVLLVMSDEAFDNAYNLREVSPFTW